jgi:hypothetical protein
MRKHLTYANVVSTICLFLVLGGAAYAGTKLAKGSVGTEQLKAEAVTKAKLHPNSVNSKRVVNGSLTGEDVDAATLGRVPNAANAKYANSAGSATNANHASSAENADHAVSADNASKADNAANAEKLDGHAPGEFGPTLVSVTEEFELVAEASISVSGGVHVEAEAHKVAVTLPGRKFRAGGFAVDLEGEAEAGVTVNVSLVVNETAEEEVCTLTAVPGTCTPSTPTVEIPPGAQVAWKIVSSKPIEHARAKLALQLLPG